MARPPVFALLAFLGLALAACATGPGGRAQLTPPSPLQGVAAVYSEIDMRLQLVTEADVPPCRGDDCSHDALFDQEILALGRQLAEAAYRRHPGLRARFPRFEFVVADKKDAGAASSAGGTVLIHRGVRRHGPEGDVLAFILAREMGHVIAGHHDENVTTTVLVSVAAQLLMPLLNVAQGLTAVLATNAAVSSTVASSAVASLASMAGTKALKATYRPQQVREAEEVALGLLAEAGREPDRVAAALDEVRPRLPEEMAWTLELRESATRLASRFQGPPPPAAPDLATLR